MRIGIDIRSLMSPIRSGVGEFTFQLLDALFAAEKQHQYFLFYNSYRDISKNLPAWHQPSVHTISYPWPNKVFNLATKIFERPRIDTLLIKKLNGATLDFFFSPNLNFTALSKNTKHILTVHDLSFELYPEFFSLKQRLWHKAIAPRAQCQAAYRILTPSLYTKHDLISKYGISPEKIEVLYPGVTTQNLTQPVDSASIAKKYALPKNFILCISTIEPRKNIAGLIKAFELFSPTAPQYHLVIAGYPGWNNQQTYRAYQSSPLKEKIHFIGSVEAQEKPALYALSRLFVYPSFYEGFGLPVIEAMNCGTPVITSNRSSLPEITDNAAVLTDPNRPGDIAQAISRIISDPRLHQHLSEKSRAQASRFNWRITAQNFLRILES